MEWVRVRVSHESWKQKHKAHMPINEMRTDWKSEGKIEWVWIWMSEFIICFCFERRCSGSGPKWPKCFHAKKPTLLHSWGLRLLSPFDLSQDVPHCVSLWKLGVLCFSPAWVPSSLALPNAKQRETSHHPGEGWGRRPLKTTNRWLDWWTERLDMK